PSTTLFRSSCLIRELAERSRKHTRAKDDVLSRSRFFRAMRPTADARDEEHPGVRCGGEDLRVVTRATRHLAWLDTGGDRRTPENVADPRRKIHRRAIAERLGLATEGTFAADLPAHLPDLG